VHEACRAVYLLLLVSDRVVRRVNVTLDPERAEKLAKLAERTHVQEGTLARSLLSQALDEADPDPAHLVELLDGIPGAFERARVGLTEARAGRTVALDDI
jgi:hypothetical protein